MEQPTYSADEPGLTPEQLDALGYLSGSFSPGQTLLAVRWLLARFDTAALAEDRFETNGDTHVQSPLGLTVLYASHTGHAASIAKRLAAQAQAKGWSVTLTSLADYSRGDFKHLRNLALVTSTHGEGEPPESAASNFEFLQSSRAPALTDCAFAVLGLGDKSYVHFCKAAVDFDARLAALGGTRLLERVDLDVDFQAGAEAWSEAVLNAFSQRLAVPSVSVVRTNPVAVSKNRYDREHPWQAEVLEKTVLSGRDSSQHFVHLELSLEGSRLKYQPGDALGVIPQNDPEYVEQLLNRLGASGETEVTLAGDSVNLREALTRRLEIRLPTASALHRYAALSGKGLAEKLVSPEAIREYLAGRDWVDVLSEYPTELATTDFLSFLPELSSRSYSIASSQSAHPDEVHLLVSRVGYATHGRPRRGVSSSYLADRVAPGDKLAVWIEPNRHFRLPDDPSIPLVLIGAGTGIAPYRSFLQARVTTGATGKHWVIFGNRSFRSDFTYQTEWLAWRARGALARMDVAFSRDQANKVYVTDKLREQGAELYAWLKAGAWVYLCGDRAKLSASVDQALVDAIARHGAKTNDEAKVYLEQLSAAGRYRKDVY